MPLIIPKDLINKEVLERENIFTMNENRATNQDIRPIKVAIVNLMPKKEETEIQILSMLSNGALQIDIDLVRMDSYKSKNADEEHLEKFYKTYEEIKNNKYDALIVTGAPVETLDYGEIKYWNELKKIFEFAKENVYSTMFICWSAQAALKYYYNVDKVEADNKIFGVFEFEKLKSHELLKGLDDEFYVPQSRHTYVPKEYLENISDLDILSSREDTGVGIAVSKDNRFVFSFGHFEYEKETLHKEYLRDLAKGLNINIPKNYYKDDDCKKDIKVKWKSAGTLFFSNWLNYCVYQQTPYVIDKIKAKKVSKFGGTSLSSASQFEKVKNIILSEKDREIIVVSAPGKRFEDDVKITDRLIEISENKRSIDEIKIIIENLKEELKEKENNINNSISQSKKRFLEIIDELNLDSKIKNKIEEVFYEINKSSSKDYIISRGEYLNALLMSEYLDYEFLDAKDLIVIDTNGEVDLNLSCKNIKSKIKMGNKVVVPGFYGSDYYGNIKTLKRGGSDYTGSIIASALDSEVYENWTDVNGIMTDNPKINKEARTISHIDYNKLEEIISKGAEVYQLDAIRPVMEKNIIVKILNTNNPMEKGTEIKNK